MLDATGTTVRENAPLCAIMVTHVGNRLAILDA